MFSFGMGMKVFYFVIFTIAGAFNILAAVFNWRWYLNSLLNQRGRPRQKVKSEIAIRVIVGLVGGFFIFYSVAVVLLEWL